MTGDQAAVRARRLYRSPGFQAAYVKGARAAQTGGSRDLCPYRDTGGWAAWRKAWLRGFLSVTSD